MRRRPIGDEDGELRIEDGGAEPPASRNAERKGEAGFSIEHGSRSGLLRRRFRSQTGRTKHPPRGVPCGLSHIEPEMGSIVAGRIDSDWVVNANVRHPSQ